jgi:septal ring factor EnvC (AmiA/AmiB activator)
MNKTESLLANYRKHLTPQYYEHIGSDWASSSAKVAAAKTQYNDMNQPIPRPQVEKKAKNKALHATDRALIKIQQIKDKADEHIQSEYAKQSSNIAEVALNLLMQRLLEIEQADTLNEQEKSDKIKLLFLL